MNPSTTQFIKARFQEHYRKDPVLSPPDLEHREWGFLMFDPASGMRRHKAFSSTGEMQEYISSMVPAHVYHSAAYYKHPSAGTMAEKTWLGADLIFDIDADHLPVKTDSFREMLEYAKQEIIKLIGFLRDDFGFREDSLHIAFSGGRGYHVHVLDPRVMTLDSAQRREIVDYLSGTGLDIDHLFRKKYVVGDDKKSKTLEFPSQSQGGWGRLVNRALIHHMQVLTSDENAQQKLMEFNNIGKKKALKIIETLNSSEHLERLKNGKFDALSTIPAEFWDDALHKIVGNIQAYIDEPVTADIKRLIRAASSLHGKSGMKVVTLTVDELHRFEPLVDAVVFGDNEIKINVTRPTTVEIMDEQYTLEQGNHVLPEYAAIYLLCRGGAEYTGGIT
ncbi:MAG: DNA primase catalytic subunit PriS [ANME-2 cluster archaeon]|nr:DNA primase catalytic subunit PriS [ANME-2 cluster archaeon]